MRVEDVGAVKRFDNAGRGWGGKVTVRRPRLMVPTNLEMATVRDMMRALKLANASMVDVEAIFVSL